MIVWNKKEFVTGFLALKHTKSVAWRVEPCLALLWSSLGDLNQTTTKNTLEKAQNTQQSTKVWLK